MAMKESVRSLSAYFIIVGILSSLANIAAIIKSQGNILAIVINGCFIAVALSFLLIGIRLRRMLVSQPEIITRVLMASFVLLAAKLAISLSAAYRTGTITSIIGFLVVLYLLANARRLSKEERAKVAEQVMATPPSETSLDV